MINKKQIICIFANANFKTLVLGESITNSKIMRASFSNSSKAVYIFNLHHRVHKLHLGVFFLLW